MLAEVEPIRAAMIAELVSLGFKGVDAQIEELECWSSQFASRSFDFIPIKVGRPATERSQLGGVAIG